MNNEADKLANEILDLSRNKLIVNLRFMDVALSCHKRTAYEGTMATDGKTLLYDPGFILRTYKDSQEEMVRMYLHMILHCVFQHPFIGVSIDERLWNLACDIAVECVINDLELNGISSTRETKQNQIVSVIKKDLKVLTAEKIYSLLTRAGYQDWELKQWEAAFKSDDHAPWYIWTETITSDTANGGAESDDERHLQTIENHPITILGYQVVGETLRQRSTTSQAYTTNEDSGEPPVKYIFHFYYLLVNIN